MNFDEYQKKAHETAQYPILYLLKPTKIPNEPLVNNQNWIYPALGLAGESGELLNKLKKIIRDNDGEIYPMTMIDLAIELGDILWYVSELATLLEVNLGVIAEHNIKKLTKRAENKTIKGNGDNR